MNDDDRTARPGTRGGPGADRACPRKPADVLRPVPLQAFPTDLPGNHADLAPRKEGEGPDGASSQAHTVGVLDPF